MDRKFEREKQQLIKIGVPEELAYIIVSKKLNINEEEVNYILKDIKEQQKEMMDITKEFKPFNENLISNNNNIDNVENKNKNV